MDDPAATAKQLVDLERRIAQQRALMAKYEQDDDVARLPAARLVLQQMQKQLAQMTKAHVAAEEHLSKLTVDEASVEKVVRDTPM
jgi:septal ring factor EnvC (AmiA/AmiB activator)